VRPKSVKLIFGTVYRIRDIHESGREIFVLTFIERLVYARFGMEGRRSVPPVVYLCCRFGLGVYVSLCNLLQRKISVAVS